MSHPVIAVDHARVSLLASVLRRLADMKAYSFCTEGLHPPAGAPGVVDLFFASTAHQYGFWHLREDRYAEPMRARIDGIESKGSDYLARCFLRAWRADPNAFAVERLAGWSGDEVERLFRDDEGRNPLPMPESHVQIFRDAALWFTENGVRPADLIAEVHATSAPLQAFLDRVSGIPGYDEDPLRKKSMLLAMILMNRPERFLRAPDQDSTVPIIDYHLQRSALRTGMVVVHDDAIRRVLEERIVIDPGTERAIRLSTRDAIQRLMDASGLGMAELDAFFFENRTRCPEMTEPQCDVCPVEAVCARRTRLFQPVHRTTAY